MWCDFSGSGHLCTHLTWNYLRFAAGVKISGIWSWTDPDLLLMEVTFLALWWKIWGWPSSKSLKIIMNVLLPDKVGDTRDVWSGGGEGWRHRGLQLWQRDPAVCSLQSLRWTTKREWKELSSRTHTREINNAVSKLPDLFNFTLVTFYPEQYLDLCILNEYDRHLLHNRWLHHHTFQQCSCENNQESNLCISYEITLKNRSRWNSLTGKIYETLTRRPAELPPAGSSGPGSSEQTRSLSA